MLVVLLGLAVGGLVGVADDDLTQNIELPEPRKSELMQRLTPVDTLLKEEGFKPGPNEVATILLNERITTVDALGRRTTLRQVAYRNLNDAGVKANSDEVIPFRRKEQKIYLLLAETIQVDGVRQPVKPGAILLQSPQRQAEYSLYDDQSEMKIIFPNVKPGSVTHMIYVVEDVVAKIPGEFAQSLVLANGWDLLLGHYQLELPEAMADKLKIETIGSGVIAPVVEKLDGGRTLYTWTVRELRGKRYELNAPRLSQVGPAVIMGTFGSWDRIAGWYRGLLDGRNVVGPVLGKAADGWIAGLKKPTDIIDALHRNVADQVRYVGLEFGTADYQPHSCDEVWENQYGDCKDKANLLVALLARCGIRAYIALVNTDHAGLIDQRVPTYHNFDHAIVAIEQPGSNYLFCDPTISHSLPGMLSPGSSDRDILLVKETGAEWVRTPAVGAGTVSYQFDLKLATNGELSGWFNRSTDGYYGAVERHRLMRLESDDLNAEMTTTLRGFFPGADIIDVARGESALPAPYTVKGYFIMPAKTATASNTYTLVFPTSGGLFAEIGDRPDRQSSFYTDRDTMRAAASIKLPAGWKPVNVPSPFESESDVIACRARWSFKDGACNTEVTIETKRAMIRAGEFKGFYQTLLALRSWLAEPVVLNAAPAVVEEPKVTEQIFLPRMPSGNGQINLVDRLYPENGDAKKRAQALLRTTQFFPEDKKTLFRAGGRLAAIDWNGGRLQDAHDRLDALLAKYAGAIDPETHAWGEYMDGLILREMHKDAEAIARLRPVVAAREISVARRASGMVCLADLLLASAPGEALAGLKLVAALPDGATAPIESRLIHALLVTNDVAGLKQYLVDLVGSRPESAEALLTSIVRDAATWTLSGDERRRQELVDLVETIFPRAGEALSNAVAFCRREAYLDQLQPKMLRLLAGEKSPLSDTLPPTEQVVSDPNGELEATLKMIAAHATLRSPEAGFANSETNRRIMGVMIDKAVHGPVTKTPEILSVVDTAASIVGTLPGHFSVDNKGAGQYSITLRLPDGRAGLEPDLSVSYYSAAGDGVLGSRCYLSTGFADAITRGRSLLARDDEVRSMELGANDRFYLDGKRLLCISAPGTHGKPGSVYRTEVDSFVTVKALGQGDLIDTFVVTDKNGRALTFGKNRDETDGYQAEFNEESKALDACASKYALKRVEDSQGNFIEFFYRHAGFGEWLLSRISYTGRPGLAPFYSVNFTYTQKERSLRTYRALRRDDNNHLLGSIQVVAGPAATCVARYTPDFEIDPLSGRYLMTTLTGELSADVGQPLLRLPPTRFQWSKALLRDALPVAFTLPTAATIGADCYSPFAAADFSGQGRLDYVDAREGLKMYVSTRNGFGAVPERWLEDSSLTGEKIPVGARHVLVGDFNGDQKKDLIVTGSNGIMYIAVSTGKSFRRWGVLDISDCLADPSAVEQPAKTHRLFQREGSGAMSRIVVADLNGDGRDDLLVHGYDERLYSYISNGLVLVPKAVASAPVSEETATAWFDYLEKSTGVGRWSPSLGYTVQSFPLDLNGDGTADYAWVETRRRVEPATAAGTNEASYLISRRLKYVLSMPRGGFSPPDTIYEKTSGPWALSEKIPFLANGFCVVPGDFNGDDLPDFLVTDAADDSGRPTWTMIVARGRTTNIPATPISPVVAIKRALPGVWHLPDGVDLPALPDPLAAAEWTKIDRPFSPEASLDAPGARVVSRIESGAFNVFALDMNHDGADDFVWYEAGGSPEKIQGWWIAHSQGDGSFRQPQKLSGRPWEGLTALIEEARARSAKVRSGEGTSFFALKSLTQHDINGDGLNELILEGGGGGLEGGVAGILATVDGAPVSSVRCAFPHLVTDFTNGYGATSSVAYRAAKDELIYTAGTPIEYPIAEVRYNRAVVSDVWHGTEGPVPSHFSYQYSGQRLDFAGRGGLGFNSFVTHDRQTQFLKYQFITHSFPMTGLTAREQTLWCWDKEGKTYLKFISSTEHKVLFDAVKDPFTNDSYGTVFPFTSQEIEERSPSDNISDFVYTIAGFSGNGEHGALFPKALPASLKFRTVSNFWHDAQDPSVVPPLVWPEVNLPNYVTAGVPAKTSVSADFASNRSRLPGRIAAGNMTRSDVSTGANQFTREAKLYRPRRGPDEPFLNVVEAKVSAKNEGKGLVVEPVISYTYFGATSRVQSETTDARNAGNGKPRRIEEITYRRDERGRLLEKNFIRADCAEADAKVTEGTSYKGSEFDDVVDMATLETDSDGDLTRLVYNLLCREPLSYTYPNGQVVVAAYDPLGRVVSVRNATNGYVKKVDYAWTTADGKDWRRRQTIVPPAGSGGLTGESHHAMRIAETKHPTVTTYYDRQARVVRVVTGEGPADLKQTDTVFNELAQEVATAKSYKPGSVALWHVTTYDAYGRVETETEVKQPSAK